MPGGMGRTTMKVTLASLALIASCVVDVWFNLYLARRKMRALRASGATETAIMKSEIWWVSMITRQGVRDGFAIGLGIAVMLMSTGLISKNIAIGLVWANACLMIVLLFALPTRDFRTSLETWLRA